MNIGRPELQKYIISVREVGAPSWPASDREKIKKAQQDHDTGLVTMCQGRAGHLIIQYAIPTKNPVRRMPYFHRQELQ